MKTVSFKCDDDYYTRLQKLARAGGKTVAETIRGCIANGAHEWLAKRKVEQAEAEKELEPISKID
jgi:predicted transcriptional regulator